MDALNACLDKPALTPRLASKTSLLLPPPILVLAKPQPFYGTCGATAKAFVGQIGLHSITYPQRFPTDASKVAFAVLFMKDYAATWSQPYLDKVFNGEPVVFN
ncbi:uncharacterized protein VP01_8771g1 [Puccinia sorghi]|uniref:DUF4939 domain-containing protein n=1 Tax=Puccinia sorghi TaxID=27349 RepID=A0A0L6U8M1_9BASI|nr:uncharacterized protein VP01_8771g1 [Puccinia sorghi]